MARGRRVANGKPIIHARVLRPYLRQPVLFTPLVPSNKLLLQHGFHRLAAAGSLAASAAPRSCAARAFWLGLRWGWGAVRCLGSLGCCAPGEASGCFRGTEWTLCASRGAAAWLPCRGLCGGVATRRRARAEALLQSVGARACFEASGILLPWRFHLRTHVLQPAPCAVGPFSCAFEWVRRRCFPRAVVRSVAAFVLQSWPQSCTLCRQITH